MKISGWQSGQLSWFGVDREDAMREESLQSNMSPSKQTWNCITYLLLNTRIHDLEGFQVTNEYTQDVIVVSSSWWWLDSYVLILVLTMCNPPAYQNWNRHLGCRGSMFTGMFLLLMDEVEGEVWGWMAWRGEGRALWTLRSQSVLVHSGMPWTLNIERWARRELSDHQGFLVPNIQVASIALCFFPANNQSPWGHKNIMDPCWHLSSALIFPHSWTHLRT